MASLFTCFRFIKPRRRKQQYLERVAAISTAPAPAPHPHIDDDFEEGCGGGNRQGTCIIRFTWDEMQRYTSNFSSVIGSGGFSNVYLAQFRDSTLGAIKIHSSCSERLNRVYKQELEILLRLRHDNIVKLLGYCDDTEEGVLVFEYVPNGNLQERLASVGGLSWKSRMRIAFQLAQALEYLHDKCPLQIVHGDIKASNILLDQQLNCKLCDFGSAKMGFSSTVLPPSSSSSDDPRRRRRMMLLGSPGYTDPHYLRTGIPSKKNDVYSFGVIVLELITGREALCSRTGERLTSVAGPILKDASKASQMLDARLLQQQEEYKFNGEFDYLLEQVKAMASISAMCLSDTPSLRPSASDIVNAMMTKVPSSLSFSFSTSDQKF
ncbi:hypothetical protein ACH5RR_017361 [Cinchona calisaya]|uniref:Protein kinase domain-containing protein n=1 Tax=Cinchona calisaya TaxID=153742 RepID=A0ABD3A172_9GENT